MPTEKPKIIFVADEDLFARIDDFRFENRFENRSEAIRRLIKNGLQMNQQFQKEKHAEIFLAVLEGKGDTEIAKDLGISETEVKRGKESFVSTLREWIKYINPS